MRCAGLPRKKTGCAGPPHTPVLWYPFRSETRGLARSREVTWQHLFLFASIPQSSGLLAKFAKAALCMSISGLVAEYIVAIDVTRVRFPADAFFLAWKCPISCAIAPPHLPHENAFASQTLRSTCPLFVCVLCHSFASGVYMSPRWMAVKNAHAGSRTRVTSMGGLYDAVTLHALCPTRKKQCTQVLLMRHHYCQQIC